MAKRKYYGKKTYKPYRSYKPRRRKSKYSSVETFAYKMALVERGRKNPDSKITESYNNGLKTAERKKKSMF